MLNKICSFSAAFIQVSAVLALTTGIIACTQTAGKQVEINIDATQSQSFQCGKQTLLASYNISPDALDLVEITISSEPESITLMRTKSAQGNRYSDGATTWFNQRNLATFTRPSNATADNNDMPETETQTLQCVEIVEP